MSSGLSSVPIIGGMGRLADGEAVARQVGSPDSALRLGMPLTELVLARRGAPRWLWAGAWAAMPKAMSPIA